MSNDHQSIVEAIAAVAAEVAQEPLLYFSETGLQSLVERQLAQIPGLVRPMPTCVERGKGSATRYATPRLQREYGGGSGTRVDLAILSTEGLEKINSPRMMLRNDEAALDYVPLTAAIEVGTEKSANTRAHARGDLEKLIDRVDRKAAERGYIFHVQRSVATAVTGSGRQAATQTRLECEVRKPFLELVYSKPDLIHVLAMILHTGRDQERMRGKCEMLLPHDSEWSWSRVNVGDADGLRNAALRALTA